MGSLPCRALLRLFGTTFRAPRSLQPHHQLRCFLHELLGHGYSSRSLRCHDVSFTQGYIYKCHC